MGDLKIELAPMPESVPKARREVTKFADAHKIDAEIIERMRLAVSEAVANVVVHAYRFGESGQIDFRAARYGDHVDLEIEDTGVGMHPDPEGDGLRLGLSILGAVADRVDIDTSGPGVRITMCFSLN